MIIINDKNSKEMLKHTYEKGKLIERPGRKATSLSLPRDRGRYGGRAAMEKGVSIVLILLARNMQSGGYHEAPNIFSKRKQNFPPTHYYWIVVPDFWAIHVFPQGRADAAQVTLAWDESNGAAGYKIYSGTTSNSYTWVVDVGNITSYTTANLTDGYTYYFAATAYDASRLESDYSDGSKLQR